MKTRQAIELARACQSYDEIDALLATIEDDDAISDAAYYRIKDTGLRAAYAHMATHD